MSTVFRMRPALIAPLVGTLATLHCVEPLQAKEAAEPASMAYRMPPLTEPTSVGSGHDLRISVAASAPRSPETAGPWASLERVTDFNPDLMSPDVWLPDEECDYHFLCLLFTSNDGLVGFDGTTNTPEIIGPAQYNTDHRNPIPVATGELPSFSFGNSRFYVGTAQFLFQVSPQPLTPNGNVNIITNMAYSPTPSSPGQCTCTTPTCYQPKAFVPAAGDSWFWTSPIDPVTVQVPNVNFTFRLPETLSRQFEVVGPVVNSVDTPTQPVQIFDDPDIGPSVSFGHDPTPSGNISDAGIRFTPNVSDPMGYKGTIEWVQLIVVDDVVAQFPIGLPQHDQLIGPPELDTRYPGAFGRGMSDFDAPTKGLTFVFGMVSATSLTVHEEFRNYLLWLPTNKNGFPIKAGFRSWVPLGYVDWGWSATVKKDDTCDNGRTLICALGFRLVQGEGGVRFQSFSRWQSMLPSDYPEWGAVSVASVAPECNPVN